MSDHISKGLGLALGGMFDIARFAIFGIPIMAVALICMGIYAFWGNGNSMPTQQAYAQSLCAHQYAIQSSNNEPMVCSIVLELSMQGSVSNLVKSEVKLIGLR